MITIELSPSEMAAANARASAYDGGGPDRLSGAITELAVLKWLRANGLSASAKANQFDRIDLIVEGLPIQVKSVIKPHYRLCAMSDDSLERFRVLTHRPEEACCIYIYGVADRFKESRYRKMPVHKNGWSGLVYESIDDPQLLLDECFKRRTEGERMGNIDSAHDGYFLNEVTKRLRRIGDIGPFAKKVSLRPLFAGLFVGDATQLPDVARDAFASIGVILIRDRAGASPRSCFYLSNRFKCLEDVFRACVNEAGASSASDIARLIGASRGVVARRIISMPGGEAALFGGAAKNGARPKSGSDLVYAYRPKKKRAYASGGALPVAQKDRSSLLMACLVACMAFYILASAVSSAGN